MIEEVSEIVQGIDERRLTGHGRSGRPDGAVVVVHQDDRGRAVEEAQRDADEALLVERNNHGHAVLLWLRETAKLTVLRGLDHEPGWLHWPAP